MYSLCLRLQGCFGSMDVMADDCFSYMRPQYISVYFVLFGSLSSFLSHGQRSCSFLCSILSLLAEFLCLFCCRMEGVLLNMTDENAQRRSMQAGHGVLCQATRVLMHSKSPKRHHHPSKEPDDSCVQLAMVCVGKGVQFMMKNQVRFSSKGRVRAGIKSPCSHGVLVGLLVRQGRISCRGGIWAVISVLPLQVRQVLASPLPPARVLRPRRRTTSW